MTQAIEPQGFSNWTEEHWEAFCSHFRSQGDREVQRRWFTGSFGSAEVTTLVALAQGMLTPEEVARVYGMGTLDMIALWKDEADAGIRDERIADTGVYDGSFLAVTWLEAKQALGL